MTFQNEQTPQRPVPPAATLEEARAAYVGPRYPLFAESFRLFDSAGGFRPTFTWPPLLFGLFWFVYRKMYIEGAVLFSLGLLLVNLNADDSPRSQTFVSSFSFGLSFVLALTGHWLYWKAVDRHLEKAMLRFPRSPDKALKWLETKGGVDPWAVMIAMAFFVFLLFWAVL